MKSFAVAVMSVMLAELIYMVLFYSRVKCVGNWNALMRWRHYSVPSVYREMVLLSACL
jgi:hypothetical protein